MDKEEFELFDYFFFFGILLCSVLIGIYHGYRGIFINIFNRIFSKKEEEEATATDIELKPMNITADGNNKNSRTKVGEYLIANSSMHPIPVAFSLFATYYSATTLLGVPAEVYSYGVLFLTLIVTSNVVTAIGALYIGPFFRRLGILSVFEYLEMRFQSKYVRLIGMNCYAVKCFVAGAIFIYGPATTLAALTKLNSRIAIGLIGGIGTFYTAIGGIKAVIWSDFFQAIIMFISYFAIVIKGVYDIGGLNNLYQVSLKSGRLNFFDFTLDPFVRQSTWTLSVGIFAYQLLQYCFDQQLLQRFNACKTIKSAQQSILSNIPMAFLMYGLTGMCGLILYINYGNCDPVTREHNRLENDNQILGYFIINRLFMFPGFSGIFLASLFAGALSSISSILNSLAAILWQDILLEFEYFKSFDDSQSLKVNKLIVLCVGICCTGFTFVVSSIGGMITQLDFALNGALNSPVIGLFILACFFSLTNTKGAICGSVCGFLVSLWLAIGFSIMTPQYTKAILSTEACHLNRTEYLDYTIHKFGNQSSYGFVSHGNKALNYDNMHGINQIYSISYWLFTPIGILTTVLIGLVVSAVTGGMKNKVDKKYLIFDVCSCFMNK